MPRVIDYQLNRYVDHNHDSQFNSLYLLKAGDTATGTIFLPATNTQGCNLVNAINASSCQITATHISIADAGGYYVSTDVEGALQEIGGGLLPSLQPSWRRHFLTMGA